jgi:hypothetical protein
MPDDSQFAFMRPLADSDRVGANALRNAANTFKQKIQPSASDEVDQILVRQKKSDDENRY